MTPNKQRVLFKSVENEVKLDTAKMIKEMEAKAKDEASAKARNM